GVHGEAAAALPDAGAAGVRRGVEPANRLERRRIEPDDPAVVRTEVGLRSPGDVDHAVGQLQGGALHLPTRVEADHPIRAGAVALAGDDNARHIGPTAVRAAGRGIADGVRAAKLLGAGGDVQGVQLFHVVGNTTANLFRPRQRVER